MATLLEILYNTFTEFWALFGIFILSGAVLTCLSYWTNNIFAQFVWPRVPIYIFGLIGVPVHEFSHAVFCKLFFHDVVKIKWFDGRGKNGEHGSVVHSYHPWNIYHRIGHFFIGLGPALLAPIFLALLLYFLVPTSRGLFYEPVPDWTHLGSFVSKFAKQLFHPATLRTPTFYLFAYLAMCILSQLELSIADIKQACIGIIPIVGTLTLVNIFSWAAGAQWHAKILSVGAQIVVLSAGVFSLTAFLSFLTLAVCFLIFGSCNWLVGRGMRSPFHLRGRA